MKFIESKTKEGKKILTIEVMRPKVVEYDAEVLLRKYKKLKEEKNDLKEKLTLVESELGALEEIKDEFNGKDR